MHLEKQRITYLDSLKGFIILLVIIGHIYPSTNSIKIWLYSFHMPIFFIISGLLFNYDTTKDIPSFVNKKIKSILIPYVMFSITTISLNLLISHALTGEIKSQIYSFITGLGIYTLWFLPALFISEFIFKILHSKIKNKQFLISITIILFLIGLLGKNIYLNTSLKVLYRSFIGLGFFSFGYFIFDHINKVDFSFLTIIASIIVNFIISYFNTIVDLWSLNFNNLFLYCFCSLLGSLSIIFLFKNYTNILTNKLLIFLGRNSLIVMATHQLIIICINSITNQYIYGYFKGLIILLIVVFLEIPIIILINIYCPFMLGKKINRTTSIKVS